MQERQASAATGSSEFEKIKAKLEQVQDTPESLPNEPQDSCPRWTRNSTSCLMLVARLRLHPVGKRLALKESPMRPNL